MTKNVNIKISMMKMTKMLIKLNDGTECWGREIIKRNRVTKILNDNVQLKWKMVVLISEPQREHSKRFGYV